MFFLHEVLIAVVSVASWWQALNREPASLGEVLDNETIERGGAERTVLDELAKHHQDVVALPG